MHVFLLHFIYKDALDTIGSVHDIWLSDFFPILSIQPLGEMLKGVPEVFHISRQHTCSQQSVGMTVLVLTASGVSIWFKY